MHLAGLGVDHVGSDTHTLLLPDHMVEVHRMIQAFLHQGAFHEVEHPIDLTAQPIILGFNTLAASLVHPVFIDLFHACNRIQSVIIELAEDAPRVFTQVVRFAIGFLEDLSQELGHTLTGVLGKLLHERNRLERRFLQGRLNREQVIEHTLRSCRCRVDLLNTVNRLSVFTGNREESMLNLVVDCLTSRKHSHLCIRD